MRKLQSQLGRAIRDERYEEAAKLRDQITDLTSRQDALPGNMPGNLKKES